MEMAANLWQGRPRAEQSEVLFRLLNCSTLNNLYGDLKFLYQDLNKTQDKLFREHRQGWDIIQTFYYDMDTFFPDHVKLFILDDAEAIDNVLKILNHICKVIKLNPDARNNSRWKILVTSQRRVTYNELYADIGADNFISVKGFTFDEMKTLFRHCNIDDRLVAEIGKVLGQRPLSLKICLSSLKSGEVS